MSKDISDKKILAAFKEKRRNEKKWEGEETATQYSN